MGLLTGRRRAFDILMKTGDDSALMQGWPLCAGDWGGPAHGSAIYTWPV